MLEVIAEDTEVAFPFGSIQEAKEPNRIFDRESVRARSGPLFSCKASPGDKKTLKNLNIFVFALVLMLVGIPLMSASTRLHTSKPLLASSELHAEDHLLKSTGATENNCNLPKFLR